MEKEIDKVLRLFHQEGAIAHEVKVDCLCRASARQVSG